MTYHFILAKVLELDSGTVGNIQIGESLVMVQGLLIHVSQTLTIGIVLWELLLNGLTDLKHSDLVRRPLEIQRNRELGRLWIT